MKSKVQYCFVSPRKSGRRIADINFIKRKYYLRMVLKGIIKYL